MFTAKRFTCTHFDYIGIPILRRAILLPFTKIYKHIILNEFCYRSGDSGKQPTNNITVCKWFNIRYLNNLYKY